MTKNKKILNVVKYWEKNEKRRKKYANKYCKNYKFKPESTSHHSNVFFHEHHNKDIEEIRILCYSDEVQKI